MAVCAPHNALRDFVDQYGKRSSFANEHTHVVSLLAAYMIELHH